MDVCTAEDATRLGSTCRKVQITFLTVYYRGGNNGNLAFYLLRTRVSDGRVDRLVSRVIQDNSSTRKNDSNGVASQVATVNNNQYMYGFAVCLVGDTESFEGATVTYTYQTAGD